MPETILLVEDNPHDVLLLQLAFQRASLATRLEVVGDGEAAIAYLSGQAPYGDRHRYPLPILVLLDLKMPRRSGFDVLAWLQQQPGLQRLPVVVFTASDDVTDINRAYDLGANAYVVKPVAFAALVDLVQVLDAFWMQLNRPPTIP